MNDDISTLNIYKLLSKDQYIIPIYQRNYDWGEREVLQLIHDIADYASTKPDVNYYIGSLVCARKPDKHFETIDGQQRFTTLTILLAVLKKEELNGLGKEKLQWYSKKNISFEHRKESDDNLDSLIDGKIDNLSNSGSNIVDVYNIIKKNITRILDDKNHLKINAFVDYLLTKVIILRILIPEDTELNHYFEIMNSRGEQLEKQEVLKAKLMSHLNDMDHKLYSDIWEACSEMTSYVQMNFSVPFRSILFGDTWDKLEEINFDDVLIKYNEQKSNKLDDDFNDKKNITDLFNDADSNIKYIMPDDSWKNNNTKDRFGSVVNFTNFLLQTLKIYSQDNYNKYSDIDKHIVLDDKGLLDIFDKVIDGAEDNKEDFVKKFIMKLLKTRYLFDKYVIKREYNNGRETWSLKHLKKYDKSNINYVSIFANVGDEDNDDSTEDNKDICMLQAMFHVSAPTQIYKYWLSAILIYVDANSSNIEQSKFKDYLFTLAKAYMLDRYLVDKDKQVEFPDIIKNGCIPKNTVSDINWGNIDKGTDVENFVFNFYDYIEWKDNKIKYKNFEFTYRTSVEHFYPQNPKPGCRPLKPNDLDKFGNLCLISRSMNSSFGNSMPEAKYNDFGNNNVALSLSIKLQEMMDVVKEGHKWEEIQIYNFEQKVHEKFENSLKYI